MLIHEKVKLDLSSARKAGEDTNNLQYVLGEFSRLKGSKDGKDYIGEVLTDEQAIRVLNSIITGENKILELVKEGLVKIFYTQRKTGECRYYLDYNNPYIKHRIRELLA